MKLTSDQAIMATNGRINKEWEVSGVSIDTRTINEGDLYISIIGNNFDGHSFIKEAIKKGANAIVIAEEYLTDELLLYPLLIVKDTKKALKDLAIYARNNFKGKVLGITGSVGKTSTKDMLKYLLSEVTKVYTSFGNFNNFIGLNLCLANLSNNYDVAVFELGMNAPNEIRELTNILRPHIVIISEIASAHSNFFKSLKDIALAKMEIIEGLIDNKILVLNYNNIFFKDCCKIALDNNIRNIYSFGSSYNSKFKSKEIPDFDMLDCTTKEDINNDIMLNIKANIRGNLYCYTISALGKHYGLLSVLCIGIVDILKYDVTKALNGFSKYKVTKGRGNILKLNYFKGKDIIKIQVINDSYNASPLSMKKSISMLKNLNNNVDKILVLGDMLELSTNVTQREHKSLKDYIIESGVKAVFTLGPLMGILDKTLPKSIWHKNFTNYKILYYELKNYLQNTNIILIKGSFSSKVHLIVKLLEEDTVTQ